MISIVLYLFCGWVLCRHHLLLLLLHVAWDFLAWLWGFTLHQQWQYTTKLGTEICNDLMIFVRLRERGVLGPGATMVHKDFRELPRMEQSLWWLPKWRDCQCKLLLSWIHIVFTFALQSQSFEMKITWNCLCVSVCEWVRERERYERVALKGEPNQKQQLLEVNHLPQKRFLN
jgi:hypothetical protein